MKNKMKKLAAMMLVAVALCGSVLTTQAAVYRGCGHPSTTSEITQGTETLRVHAIVKYGVIWNCTVSRPYTKVVVRCANCNEILHQETIYGEEQHSENH